MATYLEYLKAALDKAVYETMEDGRIFASIPQFDGLWAIGKTRDEASCELYEALDAWIDSHIKISGQRVPPVNGIDLYAPPRLVED